jgi:hypothetical protein
MAAKGVDPSARAPAPPRSSGLSSMRAPGAMPPPKRPAPGEADLEQAHKRPKASAKPSFSTAGAGKEVQKEMPPKVCEVLRGIHSRLHDGSADCAKAPEQVLPRDNFSRPDFQQWAGKVKHKHSASVTDLCPLAISIPQLCMEQMPATLYATDILHRRQISLGKHLTCRCGAPPRPSPNPRLACCCCCCCRLARATRSASAALHPLPPPPLRPPPPPPSQVHAGRAERQAARQPGRHGAQPAGRHRGAAVLRAAPGALL